MKIKNYFALLGIAFAGTTAAHAAAVSVAFDNVLSGTADETGAAPLIATAQLGWFQSGDPGAIGLDVAALQADFIEVGNASTAQFNGAFSVGINYDDTDSFEGVAYSTFAGQTMYGLMVAPDGLSVGVVSFSETFPVGESAVPPDTSSSAGWNPGTATPIFGDFTGGDIGAGAGTTAFQLQPIPEPSTGVLGLIGAALMLRRRRK